MNYETEQRITANVITAKKKKKKKPGKNRFKLISTVINVDIHGTGYRWIQSRADKRLKCQTALYSFASAQSIKSLKEKKYKIKI